MIGEVSGPERAPWLLPGELVAVRLMNTIWADRGTVHDAITTRADLRAWLADTSLSEHPVSGPELADARSLRDALRQLAARVTHDPRTATPTGLTDRAAVELVNQAIQAAPVTERLQLRGADLVHRHRVLAPPTTAALGVIAHQAAELLTDPERPLRACLAPGCVLYFVHDHPRREWCGPTCGNRARVARHYQRTRARP